MRSYFIICKNFIKFNSIIKRTFIKKLLYKAKLDKVLLNNDKRYYYKGSTLTRPESLINIKNLTTEFFDIDVINYTTDMYISHRFNVLGSGWVSADYHSEPLGIENIKYRDSYNRVFLDRVKSKVDKSYSHIDWHKDLKTGFIFNETELATRVADNLPRGVDI